MADDVAKLGIEVTSDDVLKATKRLDKLEKQSKDNEKVNKKLSSSFGLVKGAVVAFASSLAIRQFVETAGSFQSMAVSLETVTGSAEKATQAMDGIREFATNTPFQVSEITDAFIKLKALGIAPTEENLRSFGNTASAMGKSLNQMIEAVADAATGEFERLKEFGIKARSQGDNVSFTFQGVTKTVKKNSQEITEYLENIGKTTFAGAMSKQMDTINGKISNLGDTVDNLIVQFSEAGGGGVIIGALELMIDGVNGLSNAMKTANQWGADLANFFADVPESVGAIDDEIANVNKQILRLQGMSEQSAEKGTGFFSKLWYGDKSVYDKQIADLETTLGKLGEARKESEAWHGVPKEDAPGGITAAGADTRAGALETAMEFDAKDLDRIREKYTNELDLLREKTEMEQLIIDEALVFGQISAEEHEATMTDIAAGYAKDRAAIAKDEGKQKEKAMASMTSNLISLMNSGSKELFEIGKAAALSTAVVDTWKGAQSAFADTPGPVWVKAAAGIAAAAVGLSRVSSISSTTFGGGSGGGGGGATVASTTGGQPVTGQLPPGASLPGDQTTTAPRELRITVEGDGPHSEGMRQFAENLAETIEDMGGVGKLVIS